MLKIVVLVLLIIVLIPVCFFVGASFGLLLGRLQLWITARRYGKAVRAMLPPGTEVAVLLPGLAPPAAEEPTKRALLLSLFPGILLGPFAVLLFMYVIRRGRSPRLVAVGADHAWVMSTAKRSLRPVELLTSTPVTTGNPRRWTFGLVLETEAEDVSIGRFGNRRVFRAAWE